MTGKFKSSANTAHSPKSQFYEEWSKLFLENDVEKIIEPLDSEIEWEMVGESTMKGIDEIKKSFFNDNQDPDIKMTLMDIENGGVGNNITLQVLDAILCHNGEELQMKYEPRTKTKEDFLQEYNNCYNNKEILKNLKSMTLEGCVVRISDVIAYIGKDIEDAIRLNKIKSTDLPNEVVEVLGTSNSEMVNTIVVDIIKNSMDKNYISMSKIIYNALQSLINFNYEKFPRLFL